MWDIDPIARETKLTETLMGALEKRQFASGLAAIDAFTHDVKLQKTRILL